jgi:hypothetical protein
LVLFFHRNPTAGITIGFWRSDIIGNFKVPTVRSVSDSKSRKPTENPPETKRTLSAGWILQDPIECIGLIDMRLLFCSTLSTANLNAEDHKLPKTATTCQTHCKPTLLPHIDKLQTHIFIITITTKDPLDIIIRSLTLFLLIDTIKTTLNNETNYNPENRNLRSKFFYQFYGPKTHRDRVNTSLIILIL